jgi:hypothetical protein
LETVLAEAPPELRIAIALGAYVGLREADAIKVTWACYDGEQFEVRQGKTGNTVMVKAHVRLQEILDTAPRVARSLLSVPAADPSHRRVFNAASSA